MSACRKIGIICLVLLGAAGPLAANQADDFLRFLEARDESIASYEIKLRQITFDIALDDHGAFQKSVEQMAKDKAGSLTPSQQAEQLIRKWTENDRGLERHVLHRGEHFKETLVFRNGPTDITIYDGRLYYDYSARNRQLDIHATIPNVKHADLSDLGLASWIRRHGKVLSFEQNSEGMRCVISLSDDNSQIITQQYNRNFGLSRVYVHGDLFQTDDYYLFHEKIDGYSVPRLKINISPNVRRNECYVRIYAIEDIRFNRPLTDEDLSLGDLPADVLVIDYRFKPKIQWRYGEYCQAAANPDAVHNGYSKPEDMLEFLKKTCGRREAMATRDSRIGRKAPRPNIKQWLSEPYNLDTWPPGQLIVVNFWSIGCGFCIREIPENNDLSQWLKNQSGIFLSIHTTTKEPQNVIEYIENIAEWLKDKGELLTSGRTAAKRPNVNDYIDSNKIQYTVGLDEPDTQGTYWSSATFAKYGVNSIPCYVIIDRDGNVISYERTVTKRMLEELMARKPNQVTATAKNKAIQRLDVIPKGWFAHDLEPNSQIQGRFFVFRPETPDADLHELERPGDAIDCQWTRHSADNQTVYEVMLTAKTPDWGQSLKGDITLVVKYGNVEEMVTIPYELQSRNLAGCVSNILWLGPVEKGETISRTIALQSDPRQKVSVKAVSVPSDFQVNISESVEESNRILV
ncbi:MAG: TlpA family protein disulfide reductase, partial [Phycisphaerales bacterium]